MKKRKKFLTGSAVLLAALFTFNAGPFIADTGHGGVYVYAYVDPPWWTWTVVNYSGEWVYLFSVETPHGNLVAPDGWEVANGDPAGWIATDLAYAIPPGNSQCCFHIYKDTDSDSHDRMYTVIGSGDFVSVGTVATP